MRLPTHARREIEEQLRYHYLHYRQIDRTIKALERLLRLRETGSAEPKTRRRTRKAA